MYSTRPWTLRRPDGKGDVAMCELCFEDDVTDQRRGEGRIVTWGFTSRVLIACACLITGKRTEFRMDEMEEGRGPFEYFDEWLRYAEEKCEGRISPDSDQNDSKTKSGNSKL